MSAPVGYYDASYPPEVLRGYAPPLVVGATAGSDDAGEAEVGGDESEQLVAAGTAEPEGVELVVDEDDAAGEPLPEVDPSSYPPGAVDLEAQPAPQKQASPRKRATPAKRRR